MGGVFCFIQENSVKTTNSRVERINLYVKKILEPFAFQDLSLTGPTDREQTRGLGLAADTREEGREGGMKRRRERER